MKVSYQWSKEYVDISGHTGEQLAELFTRGGIEVDIVENRNKGVNGVVVGYVKSREKHPDADKLSVCVIDAGQGEDLQIVCGAKNVAAGQKVPVALIGATLPGDFQIKRAKLRGVESQGMICSAKELGLNDKLLPKEIQEGILVLPEDTEIGRSILEVLAIDDEVLELDLTPNRSDCLSMIGAAYEIAALLGREVKLPNADGEVAAIESGVKASEHISVGITAKEQCSHYAARYIQNVSIGVSPLWMQNRLMAAGIRPINNIVDITNYVMLEYGQPLHAFDADRLTNGRIDVRLANEGETLTTLDDQERKLEPHMLLITDGVKPVALAGVMGGANSEVTGETVNILLESAKFAGSSVRKTSRQLGLRSEASLRFEKESNPQAVIPALNRAAALMAQYAGGSVAAGIVEEIAAAPEATTVELSIAKANRYIGTALSAAEVQAIFARLQFETELSGDTLRVSVPNRRGDITRDVDLIEEIARLYGYDNIPTTAIEGETTPGSLTKPQAIRRSLRQLLTASGLQEVVSYSFTGPEQLTQFSGLSGLAAQPIRLSMPMSEERSTLRTSLLPQLLEVAAYNRNRKTNDVAVFEIGSVYATGESKLSTLPQQQHLLAALLTGSRQPSQWNVKAEQVDFFDLKGLLEGALDYLGLKDKVRFVADGPTGFHPGRSASLFFVDGPSETRIGYIGQVHPQLQQQYDLDDTYVLEIELDTIYSSADFAIAYKTLPRYPASERDMALVLDRAIEVGSLTAKVKETAGTLLESVRVFDIFTGEKLGEGKKSVALSLVYRHAERTLTDEEVTELHGTVVDVLTQSFGAELRK